MSDVKENGLKEACCKIQKLFCDHPHEAGESYFQHMLFTLGLGMRLIFAGIAVIIHGIFPFLCTKTGSTQIAKIFEIMKNRAPAKYGE
ncbi:MAG: hypothetical protein GC136_06680 [Alphaproteobacteria bacterium]|nr:hypothetical protein [Alphaproteobacteria bacterium]